MVHSAIVARQSRVLDTLINGSFSEASEGHATLESVDEQTFVSFIQYAYTGNYSEKWPQKQETPVGASTCNSLPVEPAYETAAPEEMDHIWVPPAKKIRKCQYCGRGQQEPSLWETFKMAVTKRHSVFRPRPNTDAKEDYTNVFISYARLYIFSDCYQIPDLMSLTLSKLGQTLILFNLNGGRVEDIVKLLEYCFGNPTPDELRSILVTYTTCKIEEMSKSESFKQLLVAHSELSARLVGELIHRLR